MARVSIGHGPGKPKSKIIRHRIRPGIPSSITGVITAKRKNIMWPQNVLESLAAHTLFLVSNNQELTRIKALNISQKMLLSPDRQRKLIQIPENIERIIENMLINTYPWKLLPQRKLEKQLEETQAALHATEARLYALEELVTDPKFSIPKIVDDFVPAPQAEIESESVETNLRLIKASEHASPAPIKETGYLLKNTPVPTETLKLVVVGILPKHREHIVRRLQETGLNLRVTCYDNDAAPRPVNATIVAFTPNTRLISEWKKLVHVSKSILEIKHTSFNSTVDEILAIPYIKSALTRRQELQELWRTQQEA